MHRPASGLWPLASAAFGHGDRLGILRVQGVLVIHVVLHNNNKCVSTSQALVHVLQYWYRYFKILQRKFTLQCTLDFATWSYTILPHGYIP
jgi:hypothetical protein